MTWAMVSTCLKPLMDEIAGQDDNVGILLMGQVNRFLQIMAVTCLLQWKSVICTMRSPAKAGGSPGDGNFVLVHFQPGRLNMPGVGQPRPASAHESC